jgi:hypothetical protein
VGLKYTPKVDETSSSAWQDKIASLAAWLKERHREAQSKRLRLSHLELQRMQGRGSYKATGHAWVDADDEEAAELVDDKNEPVLIVGRDPEVLAEEILERAREHVGETGAASHYQVLATAESSNGTVVDLAAPFKLPRVIFDHVSTSDSAGESTELMRMMRGYIGELQKNSLGMASTITGMLEPVAKMAAVGHEVARAQVDLRKVELDHERERWKHEEAIAQAEADAVASQGRASIGLKALELVAPFAREFFEKRRQSGGGDGGGSEGASPSSSPPPSAYAAKVAWAIDQIDPKNLPRIREILGEDVWDLLQAARNAATDDECTAVLERLQEVCKSWSPTSRQMIIRDLMPLVPGTTATFFLGLFQGGI